MSRRPLTNEKLLLLQVQVASYEAWLNSQRIADRMLTNLLDEPSTAAPKKSPAKKRQPNYSRALKDVTEYGVKVTEGAWECAEPKHLVGLYGALHAHLYGVHPLELRTEYGAAVSAAKKLVADEFAGDCLEAQRYVAWCAARAKKWKQQKERENEEIVRVGWRLLFKGRKWLVDWKASGRG